LTLIIARKETEGGKRRTGGPQPCLFVRLKKEGRGRKGNSSLRFHLQKEREEERLGVTSPAVEKRETVSFLSPEKRARMQAIQRKEGGKGLALSQFLIEKNKKGADGSASAQRKGRPRFPSWLKGEAVAFSGI